ncbi:uncharacterized protein EDB91DRAFT_47615 [Suillus paluster]|uniref:uncharacterized protein n=1 Tax=Suillus paluster TaxID=48578 RepID=UPI001B86FB8B|nr:uncharacterized protein EDB91DRAFT_47615 [Suillus paluster]KAG1747859.1 hypothetical protein EDB91DRAFT_47615 [Suillus paluster]
MDNLLHNISRDLIFFHPVWAHLTHVEIKLDQQNAFLHLLQLGPNLSSLSIHMPYGSSLIQAFKLVTHNSLQSLRITLTDNLQMRYQMPHLFNTLSLPNLRVLEACGFHTWPHEELKTFLARSNCPLESLIFGASEGMTTDQWRAEYIPLIPSLRVEVLVGVDSMHHG